MENSSNHRYNLLLLTYLICSALFSTVLFISSFFPITYHSNVAANFDNIPTEINGVNLNSTTHYKPSADKVVFMVIDALRWDFVNETYRRSMPYTTKAIRRNSACLMQAKANAPTVTMPRIKAMMTGMVSDFIDVVLNLGTNTVSSDSLLNQARLAGHKIIFYGDDTWIKLFPKIFHRYEGTTSFFVSDFTEVDQNVTRNINKELEKREDWSIMILHYLGLDHIGHVEGPNSPLIGPKLTEMDAVIGTILNRIERWRKKGTEALLIVCGDHGMKNSGGHGGATEEETLVPFIVFGKSCSPGVSQIEQIDVASTLAMLLGIPIPHSNVGSVAIQMIKDQSKTSQLFRLHYNAKQMFQHFKKLSQYEASDIYDDYYKAIKLHTKWLLGRNKPSNDGRFSYIASLYDRTLKNMKAILVKSAVKYEKSTLTFATILLIQVSIIFFNKHWDEPFVFNFFAYCWSLGMILWLILNHVFHNRVNEIYFDISDYLVMTMAFIIYTINSGFCAKSPDFQLPELKFVQLFFPMAIILHAISFVSSSFVEEEHQTWYFIWTTFLVVVLYYAAGRLLLQTEAPGCFMELGMILVLLLQHRILTHWNSTGNKYAHLPDIGDWLKGHETALSVILISSLTSLVIIGYICEDERRIRRFSLLFHIVLATFVYAKHTSDNSKFIFNSVRSASEGIHEVHIFWLLLGLLLVYSTIKNYCIYHNDRKKFFRSILYDVIRIWVAVSSLLHRSHNVVLVPMELITLLWMYKLTKRYNCNPVYVAYWIGNMFYFYQGNSNSLATIDVTAAYVGLQEFWPIVGTIYVCINTYSAPILAYFVIVYRIMSDNQGIDERVNIFSINKDMALLRIFPLAVYTLIVTVHRYHLFIWSVFSPKLLYEGMYTAVLLIIIVHVHIPFTLDV